jgi:hypothetical protein
MQYAEKHICITPIKREMPPTTERAVGGIGLV